MNYNHVNSGIEKTASLNSANDIFPRILLFVAVVFLKKKAVSQLVKSFK